MEFIVIALIAAVVFGVCHLIDRLFTKLFRSKAQHRSGLAVRANKRYGIFGVGLSILGILGLMAGVNGEKILTVCGIIVLLMGIGLAVHYLSYGIFYDGESFLLCRFGKKDVEHRYQDIVGQRLYVVTGGSTIIELQLSDGSAVSVQSNMDGVYPFMDTAFIGWCRQTRHEIDACDFYDPSKSWWFPHEEEV